MRNIIDSQSNLPQTFQPSNNTSDRGSDPRILIIETEQINAKISNLEEKLRNEFNEKHHSLVHKYERMKEDLYYVEKSQYKRNSYKPGNESNQNHNKYEKTITFMMNRRIFMKNLKDMIIKLLQLNKK